MFTGIILGKGKIVEKRPFGGGLVFVLEADFELPDPEEGESIAVNGVCLTAKAIKGRRFRRHLTVWTRSGPLGGNLAVAVEGEPILEPGDRIEARLCRDGNKLRFCSGGRGAALIEEKEEKPPPAK